MRRAKSRSIIPKLSPRSAATCLRPGAPLGVLREKRDGWQVS